jgi:hypothetical protein
VAKQAVGAALLVQPDEPVLHGDLRCAILQTLSADRVLFFTVLSFRIPGAPQARSCHSEKVHGTRMIRRDRKLHTHMSMR